MQFKNIIYGIGVAAVLGAGVFVLGVAPGSAQNTDLEVAKPTPYPTSTPVSHSADVHSVPNTNAVSHASALGDTADVHTNSAAYCLPRHQLSFQQGKSRRRLLLSGGRTAGTIAQFKQKEAMILAN